MSKLKPAVNSADHHTGNPEASLVLVEFGDFECPHCGHAHPLIQRLLREMGQQIHFVYRHFPLQEIHPHAFMAAVTAEAAGRQGRFWEMHDLIFENQKKLDGGLLVDLAQDLQLDMDRFATDTKREETSGKIESDFESGVRSGVNGTPGFFLNGSPVLGYDGTYESLLEEIYQASR